MLRLRALLAKAAPHRTSRFNPAKMSANGADISQSHTPETKLPQLSPEDLPALLVPPYLDNSL
jgi:hypothetical protein